MNKYYLRKIRKEAQKKDTHVITFVDSNGVAWGVPKDENNRHYREYLEWVKLGNTPEQMDEPK